MQNTPGLDERRTRKEEGKEGTPGLGEKFDEGGGRRTREENKGGEQGRRTREENKGGERGRRTSEENEGE
jgi:hypothetical protein